jgi:hypothetical protein
VAKHIIYNNNIICLEIIEEEIKDAIMSTKKGKALGILKIPN